MTTFRSKIDETDNRLKNLQSAEDEFYLTTTYLFELVNRAYDLFIGSELEQKRQLLVLTLSNLVLDGEIVRFDVQKPFDVILNYSDKQTWLPGRDSNPQPYS